MGVMRYLWGHGALGGLWGFQVESRWAWWGHGVLVWGHKEFGRDMGRSCGAMVGLIGGHAVLVGPWGAWWSCVMLM